MKERIRWFSVLFVFLSFPCVAQTVHTNLLYSHFLDNSSAPQFTDFKNIGGTFVEGQGWRSDNPNSQLMISLSDGLPLEGTFTLQVTNFNPIRQNIAEKQQLINLYSESNTTKDILSGNTSWVSIQTGTDFSDGSDRAGINFSTSLLAANSKLKRGILEDYQIWDKSASYEFKIVWDTQQLWIFLDGVQKAKFDFSDQYEPIKYIVLGTDHIHAGQPGVIYKNIQIYDKPLFNDTDYLSQLVPDSQNAFQSGRQLSVVKSNKTLILDEEFTTNDFTGYNKYIPMAGATMNMTERSGWLRIQCPNTAIYDHWYNKDNAPQLRRQVGAGDWQISTRSELITATGNKFHTGLMVYFSQYDVFYWGFCGNNYTLIYSKSGVHPLGTASYYGGSVVDLRIRKVGTTYFFEYKSPASSVWTTAGQHTKTTIPVDVGLISKTWNTITLISDFDYLRLTGDELSIITSTLATGQTGVPYNAQIQAQGGTQPYNWTIVSGALPPGLTLNATTGQISGTPTAQGTYNFTMQVSDSNIPQATTTRAFSITINPAPLLEITTTNLNGGTIGIPYSATVQVQNGIPPYTWTIVSGSLPTGLNLNTSTGQITGTPLALGTFNFAVQVTDNLIPPQSDVQALSIEITNQPVIDEEFVTGSLAGYTLYIPVAGPTVNATDRSGWCRFHIPNTASFDHWYLTDNAPQLRRNLNAGDWEIQTRCELINATGAKFQTGLMVYFSRYDLIYWGFDGSPTNIKLTRSGTKQIDIINANYSGGNIVDLRIRKVGTTYFFEYKTPASSQWTTAGQQTLTTAAMEFGLIAKTWSNMTLISDFDYLRLGAENLAITTSTLPSGQTGVAYNALLAASGGTTPYIWDLVGGQLPGGLVLNGTSGQIIGTPVSQGNFTFSVRVTDSSIPAQSATKSLNIQITPSVTLQIMTTTLPSGQVGFAYTTQLQAEGGTTPYTWALVGGQLPGGLVLNGSTGQIVGTPVAQGTFNFSVRVTDSTIPTQSVDKNLSIQINPGGPIEITTTSLSGGTIGIGYSAILQVQGGVLPYNWTIPIGALPPGLTINPTTGQISGTPTTAGTYNFTAQVTDSQAPPQSDTQALTIVITTQPTLDEEFVTGSLAGHTLYIPVSGPTVNATDRSGWCRFSLPNTKAFDHWYLTDNAPQLRRDLNSTDWEIQTRCELVTASGAKFQTGLMVYYSRYDLIYWGFDGSATSIKLSRSATKQIGIINSNYAGGNIVDLRIRKVGTTYFFEYKTPASSQWTTAGQQTITTPAMEFGLIAKTWSTMTLIADFDYLRLGGDYVSITSTTLPAGQVSVPYGAQLQAQGGTTPYIWELVGGQLPGGLVLNGTSGQILGTPVNQGNFIFSVRVSDSSNPVKTTTQDVSIQINPGGVPQITTTALPSGIIGVVYNTTVQAQGGITPYTWTISSGALPTGLTINSNTGQISGTPVSQGNFAFTVRVTDSAVPAQTATKNLSIQINPSGLLQITTTALPGGTVGVGYNATVQAQGGITPYAWTIPVGTLPPGLSLNPTTGQISGTPAAIGIYNFTVQVTDSQAPSQIATKSLSIVVSNQPVLDEEFVTGSLNGYTLYIPVAGPVVNATNRPGWCHFELPNTASFDHWSATDRAPQLRRNLIPDDWQIETRCELVNFTGTKFHTGLLVYFSRYDLIYWGFDGGAGSIKLTRSSTHQIGIINVGYAGGNVVDLRIRKVGTTYYFEYKLPASTDWTIAGQQTFAETSAEFGLIAKTWENMNLICDFDYLRLYGDELRITTNYLESGNVGDPYSDQVNAAGGLAPYTWSLQGGQLPSGLGLNTQNGAISGIPTTEAVFNFTVQVTDSDVPPATVTKALSIDIGPVADLVLTTTSMPVAFTGEAYSSSLSAQGGIAPYNWSINGGALPPGLSLNVVTGAISGTSPTVGIYNFTAQVTDSQTPAADQATANLSIEVRDRPVIDEEFDTGSLDNYTVYLPVAGPTISATTHPGFCQMSIPNDAKYDHWAMYDDESGGGSVLTDRAPQLRRPLTGKDFSLETKLKLLSYNDNDFVAGLQAFFSSFDLFYWGYGGGPNQLVFSRTRKANLIVVPYSGGNEVELRLRKQGEFNYIEYRQPGQPTWTDVLQQPTNHSTLVYSHPLDNPSGPQFDVFENRDGAFLPGQGWKALSSTSRLKIFLPQGMPYEGTMIVDVTNFDPASQNWRNKQQIINFYSYPSGDKFGWWNGGSYFNLRTGSEYTDPPGAGFAFTATPDSVFNVREAHALRGSTWDLNHTYEFKFMWTQQRFYLFIDQMLQVTFEFSGQVAPWRYIFLGTDNVYDAQPGPIYSNLRLYVPTTAQQNSVKLDVIQERTPVVINAPAVYPMDVGILTKTYDRINLLVEYDYLRLDETIMPSCFAIPDATASETNNLFIAPDIPVTFSLSQNYPNPFNPTTRVSMQLPKATNVTSLVYNVMGQLVTTIFDGFLEVGEHDFVWNSTNDFGTPVNSGVYFMRIRVGDETFTRKMLLVK